MNKYTKTYLNELSQKTAAGPYTPPTVMGVPYSNRGGLLGVGGLLDQRRQQSKVPTTPETLRMLKEFKKVPTGTPPSRRGNYMGSSQPSLLGSAANWVGNQVSSAAGNIKGLATNPLVNPGGAAAGWLGGKARKGLDYLDKTIQKDPEGFMNSARGAAGMVGRTLRRSIPGVAALDALGSAGNAIGGGLGTMFGGAANSTGKQFTPPNTKLFDDMKSQMSPGLKGLQMGADLAKQIQSPAPQMRTSAAPFGVRQIPNGKMIMPSEQQMIDEGQMDLANYGPGSVSGPDAVTPLGNKMKQNLYKIDPNTGKAVPPPPPLYPVGG